jgi:hypothetical protein
MPEVCRVTLRGFGGATGSMDRLDVDGSSAPPAIQESPPLRWRRAARPNVGRWPAQKICPSRLEGSVALAGRNRSPLGRKPSNDMLSGLGPDRPQNGGQKWLFWNPQVWVAGQRRIRDSPILEEVDLRPHWAVTRRAGPSPFPSFRRSPRERAIPGRRVRE